MALRQTTGFVTSLLKLAGLDWSVPDFSPLSRRQKTLSVNIPYQGPLHLLIDSTGIKVAGEGEWHARKHGGAKPRVRHGRLDQWRDMAHGGKFLSVLTRKHWKSGLSESPAVQSAMLRCCPILWTRSRRTRRLPPSPPMGPMTRANATIPSPTAARLPSFRPAGTPCRGRRQLLEPGHETRRCGPRDILAERSGDAGASITDEVGRKRR